MHSFSSTCIVYVSAHGAALIGVRTVPNPAFDRPVQMLSNKISHFSLYRTVPPLLWRSRCTFWLDPSPPRNLIEKFLGSFCQQIFVLHRPNIGNANVIFDAQKVSNLVCPHIHDIVVWSARSVVSHFIKGLVHTVIQLFVRAARKRLCLARNDILVFEMFLAAARIVDLVCTNPLHGPRRRQKVHPSFIGSVFNVCGCMVWNMLHGLEPIIGIAKLCNDQCFMGISVGSWILEPVLVSRQFGSNFNGMVKAFYQVTVDIKGRLEK